MLNGWGGELNAKLGGGGARGPHPTPNCIKPWSKLHYHHVGKELL